MPTTAHSQMIGGMVMEIGAALTEEMAVDTRFDLFINHDQASCEVPVHADRLDAAAWSDMGNIDPVLPFYPRSCWISHIDVPSKRSETGAITRAVAMANGWAPDGAVQDQIDDTVADAVLRARSLLQAGNGTDECADCGADIPVARRAALPGTRTCVLCQFSRDAKVRSVGINRRGSKDSQLR